MAKEMTATQQRLAKQRQDMEGRLRGIGGSGAGKIAVDNGAFVFPEGERVAGELPVIILDWALANLWYGDQEFVRGQKSSPQCFAVARSVAELVPSEASPNRQNDGNPCVSCWANKFGSGKGNAKACQNRITLAVQLYEEGCEGDIYRISVSPTATTGFRDYVQKLQSKGLALPQVVTELAFDPKVKYDRLVFRAVPYDDDSKLVPAEELDGHVAMLDDAERIVLAEPRPMTDEGSNDDDE